MKIAILIFAVASLAGCAPGNSSPPQSARSSVIAQPSFTPEMASVVCDYFAPGGANEDLEKAAIAALDSLVGKIDDPTEAVATRNGINATKELADRAGGDEKRDLLTLATALDSAALSGAGYTGWADAENAFYVKYAAQCGAPIAS